MSSSVLEKLKIKPIPKKIEKIKVKINEPSKDEKVDIKTKILDKTKDDIINRSDFIQKLTISVATTIPDKVLPAPFDQDKAKATTMKKPVKKLTKKLKLIPDKDLDAPVSRKTPKPRLDVVADDIDIDKIIEESNLITRLPPKEKKVLLRANAYYMNNRESFTNFINALFRPYKEEIEKAENTISCDRSDDAAFSLLTHQKVVRDYLNIYTPYRGLLLYHGLGSGKTCSSIAIAEGMKTDKQIIVMTPASLRMNY